MEPSAHPLAIALAQRLRARPETTILEIGAGTGRNTRALVAAGLTVAAIADGNALPAGARRFGAALSTHALLHGTHAEIAQVVAAIVRLLEPRAPLYATFASTLDSRFGTGIRIDDGTFAPPDGPEHGVAHGYFDRTQLLRMLEPTVEIESLEEVNVDDIVGRWAHASRPSGSVHWFLKATSATPPFDKLRVTGD